MILFFEFIYSNSIYSIEKIYSMQYTQKKGVKDAIMQKTEYYELIGKRLTTALDMLHFTQHQVLLKCADHGYAIGQSTFSKMLSGTNIQPLLVVQICDVLGLDVSEIFSLDKDAKIHVKETPQKHSDQIITDARSNMFRGYKGTYAIYFYTTKNEDFIHQGVFKLQEDSATHECVVDFRFKTGEKDENGNEIEKHYTGPAYYSAPMRTIYCEITSEEIGEKSYLLFHHDFLAYQNLECRLATAITVSSGVKRLPTMHKLLLSRQPLSDKELYYLCGQLKLNSSEILITENAYREFLRDKNLPKKFFEYFGDKETHAERFTASVAKVPYFSFNESLISDSFLPPLDKMKIICLLRKYSSAPRYNKISDKAEEIIYNFLQLQRSAPQEEEE